MFIRPCYRTKNGKRHAYWSLVESYRTARGSRQRIIAYLGQLEERKRRGVRCAAEERAESGQQSLFGTAVEASPEWAEVDTKHVRVENRRNFGGPWLGLELARRVGLDSFLQKTMAPGRETVPWPLMALVLVLSRLCEPSSELRIAEHLYGSTAMSDLLGVPVEAVNEDRLYRALDELLPHQDALETHLKNRLGTLFDLKYDLLLYDMTSTYFEGEQAGNPLAQRGHSRDQRPDCKQVCIALMVSREGMPLGYRVFAGNTADSKTFQEIISTIEKKYGKSDRIWVVDRGMISEKNFLFLRQDGRRYIVGTPKSELKRFEQELAKENWSSIREGLEVKICPGPDGEETFILCRSRDRREKERAMRERFETRIENALKKMEAACAKKRQQRERIAIRLGRIFARNSRAARLFAVAIQDRTGGGVTISWTRRSEWLDWAQLSEGCYLLRSNIRDWSAEELWLAYIQLTQAEAAFRIEKSDLRIRPVWHQKDERVLAHILVCFLAYVLWKTLAQMCKAAGLGDEPRRILDELGKILVVDVVLPTKAGTEIHRRCITRPTEHQAILLQYLHLYLPLHLKEVAV